MVAPLLLLLMLGSAELGNYFLNEHSLAKAVRDGARFAARKSWDNYPDCSTVGTTLRDETRNVVMYGYLSGSTALTPNISAGDVSVTTSCTTTAGGQTMTGLYSIHSGGAQIVTVNATVNYRPIAGIFFGFSGHDLHLNASSQAAVTGL